MARTLQPFKIGCGPVLDDAACVGRSELFDYSENPAVIAAALRVCSRCPALTGCAAWVESLPPGHRPAGVTGGSFHKPKRAWRS